jgi:hypothetical protein
MKVALGWCTLAMLALVACGGTKGEVTTTSDPNTMRSAPAGTATLAFLDLQATIRPDALPASIVLPPNGEATGMSVATAALPACVTGVVAGAKTTFTFNNCKAASSGTLTGTVTVTMALVGASTVYTELFDLTSAMDTTHSWHYTGTQVITITGSSATVTLPPGVPVVPIQATYTDTGNTANNKTYLFTPALTTSWSASPARYTLGGSYTFTRVGAETIAVTIAPTDPLVWANGCDYPSSGTLNLALSSAITGSASTTAKFGPTCGTMSIAGGTLTLGGH